MGKISGIFCLKIIIYKNVKSLSIQHDKFDFLGFCGFWHFVVAVFC